MANKQETQKTPSTASKASKASKLKRKFRTLDISIMIALMAVLISSISAYISLKESQIMLKQQEILAEQQSASVWPYLENSPENFFVGDSKVTYKYSVNNKGVGPAIIDDVIYKFGSETITAWGLAESIAKKHPQLKVDLVDNAALSQRVLAPGESHTVITVAISKPKDDTTQFYKILDEMDFRLEYCYCSVYGKCWKVSSPDKTEPSSECVFREGVR